MKKLNKLAFLTPLVVAIPLVAAVACSPSEEDKKFKAESPTLISNTSESVILKVKITNRPKGAKIGEFSVTLQQKGKTTDDTKRLMRGSRPLEGDFISFNFNNTLPANTEYELSAIEHYPPNHRDKDGGKVTRVIPPKLPAFSFTTAAAPVTNPAPNNDANASGSSSTTGTSDSGTSAS